jgi:hypothetical protein
MAEENGSNSDVGSQENLTTDVINLEIEEVRHFTMFFIIFTHFWDVSYL